MLTDVQIAEAATPRPIAEIAAKIGLAEDELEHYGNYKAKVRPESIFEREPGSGRLVLVTGMTPTAAGEGKTTVSVGLADGLRRVGANSVLCIREPSLGPVFGVKGGAAGGGYSQVIPMADINLHFTGDLHAITSAHALLSAALDNHLQQGNALGIDPRQITWRRAVDMNDRALRNVVIGLGGRINGVPREDGFMITAASEIMAIFCLAASLEDLETRLGNIIVGYTYDGDPVYARDLRVAGAQTLLLREAIAPNLVQTLEGTPAFVHGGPFANIAHGCNSLMATRAGLAFGDVVITEAGFGSDLGAEKFFDIKCRIGDLNPEATVLVTTIRALKLHGGADRADLATPDEGAVRGGLVNMTAHVDNIRGFGVEPVVAINVFGTDSEEEIAAVAAHAESLGVAWARSEGHARGGEGCEDLARAVLEALDTDSGGYEPKYPVDLPIKEKIERIARDVYGADGVDYATQAEKDIGQLEAVGLGGTPVCIAKTPNSLSDDPKRVGRPTGFRITVQDVRPSAGAGFVVARAGTVMTMPGLPRTPAAEAMKIEKDGSVVGLF
ncbi:MAG: formate--tetrahydrofolate ligase [Gemmatimonadota bacterium]|nr:formate--tetrahydrofolate ligase [Gemmatimonadota bacterium]